MVRYASSLLWLLAANPAPIIVADDVCLSEGAPAESVEKISRRNLLDLNDAGAHFVQMSSRTARGGKVGVSMASSASMNGTHRGVTNVMKLECESEFQPLQMLKYPEGFQLSSLNVANGHYVEKYKYPFTMVDGGYSDINACDVNPLDDIIYCALRSNGETYAVRMDATKIEFVCILPASVFSAASFAHTGEWFVSMSGGEMVVVPPIHDLQGYDSREDARLKNYRMLEAKTPPDFVHTSDTVVVQYPMKGGGGGDKFLISLFGPKLEIALYEEGVCMKTWIKKVSPARWDNIFGAGWNFQNAVFFATNRGAGVYAIPIKEIDLDDPDQVVEMELVGKSDATDFNDGLNCKNVPNPWAWTGEKNKTTGEPIKADNEDERVGKDDKKEDGESADGEREFVMPLAAAPVMPVAASGITVVTPTAPPEGSWTDPMLAVPPAKPDNSRMVAWAVLLLSIPIALCYSCTIPFIPARFNPFPFFPKPPKDQPNMKPAPSPMPPAPMPPAPIVFSEPEYSPLVTSSSINRLPPSPALSTVTTPGPLTTSPRIQEPVRTWQSAPAMGVTETILVPEVANLPPQPAYASYPAKTLPAAGRTGLASSIGPAVYETPVVQEVVKEVIVTSPTMAAAMPAQVVQGASPMVSQSFGTIPAQMVQGAAPVISQSFGTMPAQMVQGASPVVVSQTFGTGPSSVYR